MASPDPHRPSKGPAFKAGDMLGRLYRVVRQLGRGAQGHVYEVEHVRLGTRFAAKVLHPHLARDEHSIKRFEREASAASQLAHPSIARVVNFDQTEDGQHFAILELLEGEDLSERLRRGALRLGEACTLTEQVAAALAVAHEAGVVHRDLKPSNLFLTEADRTTRVKLTDFGISKVLQVPEDATKLTETGAVVGTPLYMAPEQAAGEAIDHRVDVYALGVVLFEMLAARPPFRSKKAHQLLVEKTFMESPNPSELLPGLPPRLADVLRKAIAKRPADRFQTMAELIVALQAALQGSNVDPEEVLTVRDSTPLSDEDYERATLRARRNHAPLFAIGGAALGLLVAFGVYLGLRGTPEPAPAEAAAVAPDAGLAPAPAIPQVTLTSEPAGALVKDPNGRTRGQTPLEVELERAGNWTLVLGARKSSLALDPEVHDGKTVQVVLPKAAEAKPVTRRRRRTPTKTRRPPPKRAPEPLEIEIE